MKATNITLEWFHMSRTQIVILGLLLVFTGPMVLEQWRFWWEAAGNAAADPGWTLEIRFDFFPLEPWLDGVWYHLALVVWLLGFLSLGSAIWRRGGGAVCRAVRLWDA